MFKVACIKMLFYVIFTYIYHDIQNNTAKEKALVDVLHLWLPTIWQLVQKRVYIVLLVFLSKMHSEMF